MYSLFKTIDGQPIAILELCDGHFITEWAKVKPELKIKEFKEFLSSFPNSSNAVDLMDLYVELYGDDMTVDGLFFSS